MTQHFKNAMNEAHDRLAAELVYQLDYSAVEQFLNSNIDDAAFIADFPPDICHLDIRSPWLHAAAERLAFLAACIIERETSEPKTRYVLPGAK